ncbi:TRAF-like protein [Pseudocohnilembus persalinus]|uniref:TRAF-like protein n=1 Tax=Pseudocohnilembus persalinus TaxID=266149 RepID=A0A0V0R1Y7_PSEPJ|nr:TRAF-like protein [Pseudocohnilembus persalinus]|eukprot:KRX08548.1 TRAF-like protein [Pseudocohnilembus persalinus]
MSQIEKNAQINTNYFEEFKIKVNSQSLSLESLPTIIKDFSIKNNRIITSISCGYEYCMAVENKRAVYAWGKNSDGQLGIGSINQFSYKPTQVQGLNGNLIRQIVCGETHSLFLTEKGQAYACGNPEYGKLGIGTRTTISFIPQLILGLQEMEVIKIAAGQSHSMAIAVDPDDISNEKSKQKKILQKNILFTWGSGWDSKLGHGNQENQWHPKKVQTSVNFTEISAGFRHSCALDEEGYLYIWGPYECFQISKPDFKEEHKQNLTQNSNFDINIQDQNQIQQVYEFDKPVLHPEFVKSDTKFKQVCLFDKYSLALDNQDRLYMWGEFDQHIQQIKMEKGHTNMEQFNIKKMDENICFEQIVCSRNHAAGLQNGWLYTWGIDNNIGRLGLGYQYYDKKLIEQENLNQQIDQKQNEEASIYQDLTQLFSIPQNCSYLNKYLHNINIIQKKQLALNQNGKFQQNRKKQDQVKKGISYFGKSMEKSNKSNQIMSLSCKIIFKNKINYFFEIIYLLNRIILDDGIPDLYECLSGEYKYIFDDQYLLYLQQRPFKISYEIYEDYFNKEIENQYMPFMNLQDPYRYILTSFQVHPCYCYKLYKFIKKKNDTDLLQQYKQFISELFGELENSFTKQMTLIQLSKMILKKDIKHYLEARQIDLISTHTYQQDEKQISLAFRIEDCEGYFRSRGNVLTEEQNDVQKDVENLPDSKFSQILQSMNDIKISDDFYQCIEQFERKSIENNMSQAKKQFSIMQGPEMKIKNDNIKQEKTFEISTFGGFSYQFLNKKGAIYDITNEMCLKINSLLDDLGKALEHHQISIELDKYILNNYLGKGYCLAFLGRNQEAIQNYDQAQQIKQFANNKWLIYNKANSYLSINQEGTPWKLGKAHRIYRNTIANTKICCENQKLENGQDGCQEVFPFEKIDIHQNEECKFRKVVCQNNGCKRQFLFKDLEAHDKICEYKQLPCEMCGILKAIQNDHNCVQQLSLKINYLEKKMEKMYTKEEVDQKLKGYVSIDYFKRYQEAVEKKIAAIINQDFLGEIKNNQLKCPNDHDLKKITLNHPNIKNLICDLCGNRPYEKRSPSFRCDICDFDKCQQCIKN